MRVVLLEKNCSVYLLNNTNCDCYYLISNRTNFLRVFTSLYLSFFLCCPWCVVFYFLPFFLPFHFCFSFFSSLVMFLCLSVCLSFSLSHHGVSMFSYSHVFVRKSISLYMLMEISWMMLHWLSFYFNNSSDVSRDNI